ncbi:MAG: T9SS type A sorting domain-containing protein [Bacteroidetes bacterium]|nr:MAG: T9SS type A sorting domain-containing protein [Bacteroidota bacterium]
MKTPLRYLPLLLVSWLSFQKTLAQCTVSNILIQNIVQAGTQTAGSCTATFDLSFTMETNNGNKFIFLHGWAADVYPDFFNCVDGLPSSHGTIQAPTKADLGATFLNIGIDNSGATPVLLTTYPPDATLTFNTAASVSVSVLPDGSSFFIIHGVTATFPVDCNTPFLMALDFWSSQAAQAQNAQCVSCHRLYAINYLADGQGALANCVTLSFSATLTNHSQETLNGYYLVYADVNGDAHLAVGTDLLIVDTTQFSVAAGASMPVTGSVPVLNINQDLILVATITGGVANGGMVAILIPSTQCSPLPVTFKSFNANRVSRTNVGLKWETATEANNSGFAVQRNMGAGVWEFVAFVPTQANEGNSSMPLTYTFTDVGNSSKGVTQYRIKQVDIDSRARFSEVRAVRAYQQSGKIIVYPNPSTNGRVNVVFDDAEGTRDVMVMDMSGRLVKQWKGVTGNLLQIDNLAQGMYSLRVINRDTDSQSIEKFVVNNR